MGASVNTEFLNLFVNDWFMLSDMADFFIGEFIANGQSRSVYNFNFDKRCVVKIDRNQGRDNTAEFEIWNNLKDTEHGRYLAPCISLSSCGRLLIQKKTQACTLADMPKEIPDFFSDTKLQNWGLYKGRLVAHDYANHSFYNRSKIKMVPAEWWSDTFQIIKSNGKNT